MVRKVIVICSLILMLAHGFAVQASAEPYQAYQGNIGTSYLTYFQDLLPKLKLNDHYVFFRSDQYEYMMVVGDLEYNDGIITSADTVTVYTLTSNSSYNSYYAYNVSTLDEFTLYTSDILIYSDIGNFPELEERGHKYEVLQTITFGLLMLCIVVNRILYTRKR